jgi:hypothetical protein
MQPGIVVRRIALHLFLLRLEEKGIENQQ